jgi:glutaredoxin
MALGMQRSENSVTGPVYNVESGSREDFPMVQLYTKEGCTLCDKVSNVLRSVREECPHSLEAIDITDSDKTEFYDKYKWDIPVLHIDGKYWTKHKLDAKEAVNALTRARNGEFEEQRGEPNAAAMEQRMAERKSNPS